MSKSIDKQASNIATQSTTNKAVTKPLDQSVIDNMLMMNNLANPLKGDAQAESKDAFLMESINPQDGIEAMLASQMTSINNQINFLAIRASVEAKTSINGKYPCNNMLAKFMNVYTRQMESFVAYRGKQNHQKITVEQVNVGNGGQAVVGNINQGDSHHG